MTDSQIVLKLFLDEVGLRLELDPFAKRVLTQKKTYLTQLTGFELGFRFAWYVHGPYCRELTAEAFALKEALDAKDRVPPDKSLNPLAKRLLSKARTFWTGRPTHVNEDDWLELLASLHYLKHIAYWPKDEFRAFPAIFRPLLATKPKFPDPQA